MDEAQRQVEPAAHATRVAAHDPIGGIDEAESLERLAGAPPRLGALQTVEASDHLEVLAARERVVDGCELPGQADQRAHARCIAQYVEAENASTAGVGPQQRREHAHERGLAGAVRAQEALHRAGADRQVDAGERACLVERDGHVLDLDCLCGSLHRNR